MEDGSWIGIHPTSDYGCGKSHVEIWWIEIERCKLIKKVHCVSNLAPVKTNGLVICFTSTDVLFGMARMAQHLTQQRSQEVACLDLTQQEAWEMAQCSLIF